jgi:hypothetical protein
VSMTCGSYRGKLYGVWYIGDDGCGETSTVLENIGD